MSTTAANLSQPISEKLNRNIFLLWKVQVVPIVRGARLFGYLDGTVSEPATTDASHGAWAAQDQQVLVFINASLLREVLGHVATCTTSVGVWKELNSMFASQLRVCVIQLQTRLATTRKGDQSPAVYYNKTGHSQQ
jgi:hypothetical protein